MMEAFDYIVVGAGSAGCAVAARLSEDGTRSVLVLEAGGRDSNPWIRVPAGFGKTFTDPSLTWTFSTEASPELNGRQIYVPSGKVLGGSSSINGLVYSRGQAEDFDNWRQDGNAGWGYDDVLPFFRKSEGQQHGGGEFHGADGPLKVSDLIDRSPLCQAFVESAVSVGFPRNDDFNGSRQEGIGYFQMTARNGRRVSSAAAFLHPAKRRHNVSLKTRAQVERLVIERGRVTGVTYRVGNRSVTATAKRAVVLSSGALNTPAILQRSGIGRGEWLQDAGIEVRHELRGVGANLHDHLQARLAISTLRQPTLNTLSRSPIQRMRMGLQYALFRRGPLTSSGGQSGGFIRSRPGLDRPDMMLFFMPFSSLDYRLGLDRFSGFTISTHQLRPESRGTLRVKSADPHEPPLIQPNYLEADIDRRTVVAALRVARQIVAAAPISGEIKVEERPGPDVRSDDDLLTYVRSTGSSVYHPVGTCRMGVGKDAVVDARLRVLGLEGLVVADNSIMPSIVSSPTNATAIMIGERAAAFLLEHP